MAENTEALQKLFNENSGNDIFLDPPNIAANHAPQDLIRLFAIGASAEQLSAWYELYLQLGSGVGTVRKITGQAIITRANWKEFIGQKNWLGWTSFFSSEIEQLGLFHCITKYLAADAIGPNLCGYLLHGLISLGYGLEVNSSIVVSEGLAQCAMVSLSRDPPLSEDDSNEKRVSTLAELIEILDTLALQPEAKESQKVLSLSDFLLSSPPLIRRIVDEKIFVGRCDSFEALKQVLDLVLHFGLSTFIKSGIKDFVLLHVFTSSYAIVQLCRFLFSNGASESAPLLRIVLKRWFTFCFSAYLFKGCPNFSFSESHDELTPPWSNIIECTINHQDEHTVKAASLTIQYAQNHVLSDFELENHLPYVASILLKIPSPPAVKFEDDDWIYPTHQNPFAQI